MNAAGNPLEGHLSWSGRLPVQWRVLDGLPGRGELARAQERNEALLRALALIEEGPARLVDEPSPLVAQMERLEAKFDLVLTLLSEVLLADLTVPDTVPVRLSACGLEFATTGHAEPGASVELSLFFSNSLPRPVVLYGVVAPPVPPPLASPSPAEEQYLAVTFQQRGPAVGELLERLVFRRHRRSIALQRPQNA